MVSITLRRDRLPLLRRQLDKFTGSPCLYELPACHPTVGPLLYTEGIRFLMHQARCEWLFQLCGLGVHCSRIEGREFLLWRIEVRQSLSAIVTVRQGNGYRELRRTTITRTNFPLGWLEWYTGLCENSLWMAMLKSEF